MHLQSYNFEPYQKKILQETVGANNKSKRRRKRQSMSVSTPKFKAYWEMTKTILKAWKVHLKQIKYYIQHRNNCKLPFITCCDLNNPPYNYIYRSVKGDQSDTFIEVGSGMGKTYGSGFASFRIDYIFTSPEIKNIRFYTLSNYSFSDHTALLTQIRLPIHH